MELQNVPAENPFTGVAPGLVGVFIGGLAVTPSDATPLTYVARGLHIGTAGDVKVVCVDDSEVTFKCVAGQVLPWGVKQVKATGTTASNIVAGR